MCQNHSHILAQAKQHVLKALATASALDIQKALEEYTETVEALLDERLCDLDDERIHARNHDQAYPYRFSSYHHDGSNTDYLFVDVKEPWYHDYLDARQDMEGLSSDEEKSERAVGLCEELQAQWATPPEHRSD